METLSYYKIWGYDNCVDDDSGLIGSYVVLVGEELSSISKECNVIKR
jgi:hypothetical protein